MSTKKGTVEILPGTAPKTKGQFRFVFKGENGKKLSDRDFYHNKADLLETLNKYFPNFEIKDKTS